MLMGQSLVRLAFLTGFWLPVASGGDREKRYIFINPDAPITLGFLLNLPIALALPTIVNKGRALNMINDAYSEEEDNDPDLFVDSSYEQQLNLLQVYFSSMEILSMVCQERLLCELSASPDIYSPVSDLMLKELRQTNGQAEQSKKSIFWRYVTAAREGLLGTAEDCAKLYPKCPVPAYKILNMPVINVWQFIASKLNVQLM